MEYRTILEENLEVVFRYRTNEPVIIVPMFIEQSTLVHEMGHALGFVNNGVPMASPHQDSNLVMWGPEVLSDARVLSR